jgi:hypothetical protein
MEGLASVLGLRNPLSKVLANWPGSGPGFLFLDALDACRFGKSEALFRSVIQEVLELKGRKWHVIASIRTFDLLMGKDFARLFRGVPPDPVFVDPRFQAVRHIRIGDWSDSEFEELLSEIPSLKTAVDNGGSKIEDLARTPFNTRLLAELLSLGVAPEALEQLNSQVQLLEMYWDERVRPIGIAAERCLLTTVTSMIDRGKMETSALNAGMGTGDAVDRLLQSGVLISIGSGGRDVAFRHHVLFDYVASRTLLDLNDIVRAREVLNAAGAGLLLAPAFSFALQHLWESSSVDRRSYWETITALVGDDDADPITRSVASRSACELPSEPRDVEGFLSLLAGSGDAQRSLRHIVARCRFDLMTTRRFQSLRGRSRHRSCPRWSISSLGHFAN